MMSILAPTRSPWENAFTWAHRFLLIGYAQYDEILSISLYSFGITVAVPHLWIW